jgi:hypothetical protein
MPSPLTPTLSQWERERAARVRVPRNSTERLIFQPLRIHLPQWYFVCPCQRLTHHVQRERHIQYTLSEIILRSVRPEINLRATA